LTFTLEVRLKLKLTAPELVAWMVVVALDGGGAFGVGSRGWFEVEEHGRSLLKLD